VDARWSSNAIPFSSADGACRCKRGFHGTPPRFSSLQPSDRGGGPPPSSLLSSPSIPVHCVTAQPLHVPYTCTHYSPGAGAVCSTRQMVTCFALAGGIATHCHCHPLPRIITTHYHPLPTPITHPLYPSITHPLPIHYHTHYPPITSVLSAYAYRTPAGMRALGGGGGGGGGGAAGEGRRRRGSSAGCMKRKKGRRACGQKGARFF
jgi:hypothetical protein